MNVTTFFKRWSIVENPFMAEEARQDDVFARLEDSSLHPDFHKILGDPRRPSSAVVFGEKGSGKTAIRLHLETRLRQHNEVHPDRKSFIVSYDELNPVLDRFARRVSGRHPLDTLQRLRLVDHMDGILSTAVPRLVDAMLGRASRDHGVELGPDPASTVRRLDTADKQDWLVLQALYDRPDRAVERGDALRKRLRVRGPSFVRPMRWLAFILLALLAVAGIAYAIFFRGEERSIPWLIGLGALAVLTVFASGKALLDRFRLARTARHLSNQLRVLDRSRDSFRLSLESLPGRLLASTPLPEDDLDDPRYEMMERLLRVVRPFGYENAVVLIDRIDEPTLVNGETDRMKAVVFPLFNNKFLQQDHYAFKMMLPLELRHELFRQNENFFKEARLDKQNMIDRLVWSGATLYDLCGARINACREQGTEPIALTDLFEPEVTRQDLIDALDQMRQPRDAFKMMYQVIHEHCTATTEEEADRKIPRFVLDQVRRGQADRLEGFRRGQRPA